MICVLFRYFYLERFYNLLEINLDTNKSSYAADALRRRCRIDGCHYFRAIMKHGFQLLRLEINAALVSAALRQIQINENLLDPPGGYNINHVILL